MTIRPILLTYFFLLFSSFSQLASAEVILEWKFDDPSGTGLSALKTSTGANGFTEDADGVQTNGSGQLVVRNTDKNPRLYYAPLPEMAPSQPLWLTFDIVRWISTGDEKDEGIRLGFSSGTNVSDQIADLRLTRDSNTRVQMAGRAGGEGDPWLDSKWIQLPVETRQSFGIHLNPEKNLYAVFSREGSGPWEQRGFGTTDPGRGSPKFVRLNLYGHLTDETDEGVILDGITVHDSPPTPEMIPEFLHPEVTADAWVVANITKGEIVASKGIDERRKNASITKAMAAYTIIMLAQENPAILEERVVFSELAASTGGSTSDVEQGEYISVHDALYALMLPSGNDAGNALAEHFNPRLPDPVDRNYPSSFVTRQNFVHAMNENAEKLGMKDTQYRIPYGDGGFPTNRTTSAADLVKLATAAMELPLFRKVVSTKSYTADVFLPDGSTRKATWENTNQFLGSPGFFGIKTGTTSSAGACLMIACASGGDGYIINVHGSDGSDQRYDDVRRLIEIYLKSVP